MTCLWPTCYLAHPAVIQNTVERLQSAVTDPVLVEVWHSTGHVGRKGESEQLLIFGITSTYTLVCGETVCVCVCWPEAPVKRDLLIKKDIVQASFWAILSHYGNVGDLNAATNKLAEVWMIKLPGETLWSHCVHWAGIVAAACVHYLTCLTSCLMVLDKENILVWILLMATVWPSLREKIQNKYIMHLDLQHHQTAQKDNIRITSGSNSTVRTTGVLTRSQCKWRGSCGCSVGQCRCWVPSHSWCCCHCFLRVGCSWCYPWSWDLPDLRKNNWGSGTYCWILDTRILSG